MNKVILMGRLTRDPDVRYSQNSDGAMAIARYTLAETEDVLEVIMELVTNSQQTS